MKFTKVAALMMSLSMVGATLCACNNAPQPVSSDVSVIGSQSQVGLGNGEPTITANIDNKAASENFVFKYKGVDIICSAGFDDSKFNKDDFEVQQEASCAGQGYDTVFYFKGGSVQVWTHPVDDQSGDLVIWAIQLCDDTVSTSEGIYIGSTREQVKAVYGEPLKTEGYDSTDSVYFYVKGTSSISIFFKEGSDVVSEISYRSTLID